MDIGGRFLPLVMLMNGNIDPAKRERADDKSTLRPRWRLPVIIAIVVMAMAVWLVLTHLHVRWRWEN